MGLEDQYQEQLEELETIKVIYEEDIEEINIKNKIKFKLKLKVTVTEPIQIKLKSNNHTVGIIELEYLPPLEILFDFPANYPLEASPTTEVQAIWITHNNKIKIYDKLQEICDNQQGSPIVFEITNWIQSDLIEFLFQVNSNKNSIDVEDDMTDQNNEKLLFLII